MNARQVKQVPGRKTDLSDAAWLCQLLEAGLLRASFVPPKPIRALRNFSRYRKAQIAERQREANRLHKALEDTGIKLDCVASDVLGVSGRAMLDALVAGTTHPELLAELARGRLRQRLPALREALEGRFDPLHAVLIGAILAHLDFLDEQIERLSEAIEEQLRPFAPAVELLRSIPGVETRTAQVIIAEIGVEMSVFPSDRQLASWAGQCPGNDQSAGKRRSGRTRNRSKWLDQALKEAAMAAIRTNDSYLQAQYQRLRPRVGHGRALGASSTRSSAPAGTCSPPASSTATSAPTTSAAATPNTKPAASSPNSKRSDTPSPCRKPPDLHVIFPSDEGLLYVRALARIPTRYGVRGSCAVARPSSRRGAAVAPVAAALQHPLTQRYVREAQTVESAAADDVNQIRDHRVWL